MEEKKVVLITGTSSGFGRETVALLSKKGYHVFGTSRNPSKKDEKESKTLQLDVTSELSVVSCISSLMKKTNRIDVLVNNAGYVSNGALEESSLQDAMHQFETNFFGAVRMVDAVLPIMRNQKAGQIINIASLAGIIPAPFQGFYAPTKAAVISYSEVLRQEVKGFNIKVSVVEPGFFNTHLFYKGKNTSKTILDYKETKARAIAALKEDIKKGADPIAVAETIARIIKSRNPRLHYPVGKEKGYLLVKKIMPEGMFESALRQHWRLDK